jgi:hypothetical protein
MGYNTAPWRNGISYVQEKEGRLTGVATAFQNTILKERKDKNVTGRR